VTTSGEQDPNGSSFLPALFPIIQTKLFILSGKVLVDRAFFLFAIERNKGPAASHPSTASDVGNDAYVQLRSQKSIESFLGEGHLLLSISTVIYR
jgi:hypothetical protein